MDSGFVPCIEDCIVFVHIMMQRFYNRYILEYERDIPSEGGIVYYAYSCRYFT